jgi:hypothetical protein
MDALSDYTKRVSKKVQAAGLVNVRVVKRDALDTGLDAASIDKVLLFGVSAVVWCDSFPFLALESAFTRNAPHIENERDLGSVVVSGFWFGAEVDPSIRVITEIGNNQLCRISNRLKSLLFST